MVKKTQMPNSAAVEELRNSVAAVEPPAIPIPQEFQQEAPKVPLSHYVWILRRHLWKIIAFVAVCMLITFIFSARLKPIYESTATIDIDMAGPSTVVGQGSTSPTSYIDPEVLIGTQIHFIQTDAVLRPVAEQFHLLGDAKSSTASNPKTSQESAGAPVSLVGLRVTRPVNTYLLLINYRASDPRLAADVANAIANSYLAQTYELRIRSSASLSSFMEQQLDGLKAKMERSNLALAQYEKDMDVINPAEKTDMLSARLLQLNTEYTTAQTDRVSKESAWNAMKSGSLEAAEISSQGASLARLKDALNLAQTQFTLVSATYGKNHPEYRKAAADLAEAQKQFDDARRSIGNRVELEYRESLNREQMLQETLAQTKAEWDSINVRSFQFQQLNQEATTDRSLYDELTKKIHEEDINAGFKDNNIRIVDVARPSPSPVYPNVSRNVDLAFLLSTFLAIGTVILLDSFDKTLRDATEASRFLSTQVIGTLPLEKTMPPVPKLVESETEDVPQYLASMGGSKDGNRRRGSSRAISGFEEGVRMIRNTILLSDFEKRLQSIVITSAEPGEGKTTVSVYLAIANADQGKKTLLVDGDLRRPSIHARFGLTPQEGLSSVLNGQRAWPEVVLPVKGHPNLSLLPSGPGSHRAADLIGPHLAELLDEFAKEYDLVILDSPPLLGFAESLQMADAADGVLIVTRAGNTKRKAVAAVVSTLKHLRANIIGVVLNQVSNTTSEGGYSYYGYDHYRDYQKTEG
jgi:capsular exopolysaccharide synthesis family protein